MTDGRKNIVESVSIRTWANSIKSEGKVDNGYQFHNKYTKDKVIATNNGTSYPQTFQKWLNGIAYPRKKFIELAKNLLPSSLAWLKMGLWEILLESTQSENRIVDIAASIKSPRLHKFLTDEYTNSTSMEIRTKDIVSIEKLIAHSSPQEIITAISILLLKAEKENKTLYSDYLLCLAKSIMTNCAAYMNSVEVFNDMHFLLHTRFFDGWGDTENRLLILKNDFNIPRSNEFHKSFAVQNKVYNIADTLNHITSPEDAYSLLFHYSNLPFKVRETHIQNFPNNAESLNLELLQFVKSFYRQ